jgi:hypothetical protein
MLSRALRHVVPSRCTVLNLALATAAVVLLNILVRTSGHIELNDGLGFDGVQYGSMVERGLTAGTPNTRLRPVVIILAWLPYHFTGDVIRSFRILNYVWAFLGAYLIAKLHDHYQPARILEKVYLILSLALCIATAKMFAYYPVLVDLGGYVFITAAVYAILTAPRPVAGAAVCLAMLTREFGIAAALFGLHRDIRQGSGIGRALLTYLPAIAVFVAFRHFAIQGENQEQLTTVARLVSYLEFWHDPLFVGFFIYFLVTLFGGISMIVVARIGQWARLLNDEPEWVTFAAPIIALTVLGSADMWRYSAYLLPLIVVLFARATAEWTRIERVWRYSIAAVGTSITQRPFQHLDLKAYFVDWFPYYVFLRHIPDTSKADLWPTWGWRFVLAAVLLLLLSIRLPMRARRY